MTNKTSDGGFYLTHMVEAQRGMSPSEIDEFLRSGFMPDLSQPPPEELNTERQVMSLEDARDLLSGRHTVTASSFLALTSPHSESRDGEVIAFKFDKNQLRDPNTGRWVDNPVSLLRGVPSGKLGQSTKKLTPAAIYKKYADGATVAQSTAGDRRMRWDAGSKKFIVERHKSDAWVEESRLAKTAAYNETKEPDKWFEPVKISSKSEIPTPPQKPKLDVADTDTTAKTESDAADLPKVAPPPFSTAVDPATTTPNGLDNTKKPLGAATKAVFRPGIGNGEIIAISKNDDQRLRWDAGQKKFLLETRGVNGEWETAETLNKNATYQRVKGGDWYQPGSETDAPTTVESVDTPPVDTSPVDVTVDQDTADSQATSPVDVTPVDVTPQESTPEVPKQADAPEIESTPKAKPPIDLNAGAKGSINADEAKKLKDQFVQSGIFWNALPYKIYNKAKSIAGYKDKSILQILTAIDKVKPGYKKSVLDWIETPIGSAWARGEKVPAPPTPQLSHAGTIPSRTVSDTMSYPFSTAAMGAAIDKAQNKKHGGLTSKQVDGLKRYTMNAGYREINNYLRGIEPEVSDYVKNQIAAAQSAMRPSTQPILLTRGAAPPLGSALKWDDLPSLEGQTFQELGFLSTSAGKLHQLYKDSPVIIEIEAPTGTPMTWVKNISSYPQENEMLLAAGLKYHVVSVKQTGDKSIVRMRVVP